MADKKNNSELDVSDERFRMLVETIKDYAIFRLDPAGKVSSWNEGARRLKGFDASEVIGKHFSLFYSEEDKRAGKPENELKVVEATGRYEEEGWRIRKGGARFWANTIIARIDDENGKLVGFSKITRDLSERKVMEDRLRQSHDQLEARVRQRTEELSEALSVRDEFLSIASHELKTPLTGLKLQFQIARRSLVTSPGKVPTQEDLVRSYDLAIRQINSLANLVEGLLDTTRIQSGNFSLSPKDMDLSELTKDVVSRFSEQFKAAKCSIEVDLHNRLLGSWDRSRIEQVIVNLISNAIKHAPKSAICVSTKQKGESAYLVVKDFGPGIPKILQPKVFERFERAQSNKNVGGLGLGLYIVRSIVELHQGNISLESDEGKGAKFTVCLPLQVSASGAE